MAERKTQVRDKESQALGRKPRGKLVGGKSRIESENSVEREMLLQGRETILPIDNTIVVDKTFYFFRYFIFLTLVKHFIYLRLD